MSERKNRTKKLNEPTHELRVLDAWLFITQCSMIGHVGLPVCAFCDGQTRKALPDNVRVLHRRFKLEDGQHSPEVLRYNEMVFIRLGAEHPTPVYWQKIDGTTELKDVKELPVVEIQPEPEPKPEAAV